MPIIDHARNQWESATAEVRRGWLEAACNAGPIMAPFTACLAWHDVDAKLRIAVVKYIRDNGIGRERDDG